MKQPSRFGWIGRHKISAALLATALLSLIAAIGAFWLYPRGPGLESFLEHAAVAQREAEKMFEGNQPNDAEEQLPASDRHSGSSAG